MKITQKTYAILLIVFLLTSALYSQDKNLEISGVFNWTKILEWEGDPYSLEWDSNVQYGVDGKLTFDNLLISSRLMFGDFDVEGPGLEETWSLNNLEVLAGYKLGDSPFYILAGYKHWEFELDETSGMMMTGEAGLNFSFDGIGGGAGVYWTMPDSGIFFQGQALYFTEIDSSMEVVEDSGFTRALTFNGEIGFEFENGFFAAAGGRFEQVAQELPEEKRVAPFIDYGFEQFSATFRLGYRFGY